MDPCTSLHIASFIFERRILLCSNRLRFNYAGKQTETITLLGVKIHIFLISTTDMVVSDKLQKLNTKTKTREGWKDA